MMTNFHAVKLNAIPIMCDKHYYCTFFITVEKLEPFLCCTVYVEGFDCTNVI